MLFLKNNKKNIIMYIAESKTDMDVLHDFIQNKRLHGIYEVYDHKDKKTSHRHADFLQKNFPLAYGLALARME